MSNFEKITSEINALGSCLANAKKTKASVDQCEELKKALKLTKSLDWVNLPQLIEGELSTAKEAADRQLGDRRQRMLETAKEKGIHFRADAEADTVDVFKVRFKGRIAVVEFAGVEIESSNELDGFRLTESIIALKARLEKGCMGRSKFFALAKDAIEHAQSKNPTRDGFVGLMDIYKEVVFELAWSKSAFAKTGLAKHFPDYPFFQFLWDLAAFVSGGNREGGFRLAGRTPAMSERAVSYKLPNLIQPQAQGEVLHLLTVQKINE